MFVFYINNCVYCIYFNKLYDSQKMKKVIKNTDIIIYNLELALIRAINYRLEFAN